LHEGLLLVSSSGTAHPRRSWTIGTGRAGSRQGSTLQVLNSQCTTAATRQRTA
jgi:hypothetical protein